MHRSCVCQAARAVCRQSCLSTEAAVHVPLRRPGGGHNLDLQGQLMICQCDSLMLTGVIVQAVFIGVRPADQSIHRLATGPISIKGPRTLQGRHLICLGELTQTLTADVYATSTRLHKHAPHQKHEKVRHQWPFSEYTANIAKHLVPVLKKPWLGEASALCAISHNLGKRRIVFACVCCHELVEAHRWSSSLLLVIPASMQQMVNKTASH